jgi:hypothetical protein
MKAALSKLKDISDSNQPMETDKDSSSVASPESSDKKSPDEKKKGDKKKKCSYCGKTKNEEDMLLCSHCKEYYHFACLELPPISLSKIKEHDITKWKCSNCKDCTVCQKEGKVYGCTRTDR